MPRKIRSKKPSQTSVIIASLLLLLSLPLMVYALLQKSFDIRNQAYDMLELSEKNPCIISFPNVNPYSLEVGKSIRVQVDAKFSNSGIKKLEITNPTGSVLHTEDFPESPLQIGTSFIFTPENSGGIDMLGIVEKTDGGSAGCRISSPYDVKGLRAVKSNSSPEFTSNPTQSKPSQAIKTGTQYEYHLSASDTDGDRINYSYSFTPRADWLKPVIIEDGSNGKLAITFRGFTDQPASYLANVIIHDGYSKHVRSQSWVISVGQAENDVPKVLIIKPEESLRIDAGRVFDASWEVEDLNHITSFELFMAKNITDEASWNKIGEKLPYNVLGSSVATKDLDSGTYKLLVRATDNQEPPKSGLGVSPEIVISRLSDNVPPSDDVVILDDAQVINMSPSTEDNVSNPRATIKGTLIASEGAEIKESSITFKVDDKDVTDKMKINKISGNEYTLIYQPTEDLLDGIHKGEISFEDTKGKKVLKSWDFTIKSSSEFSGSYNIFGMEVSKRTVFIIGIGILLIVIAICIPLLIAAIWGRGKKETEETTYITKNTPDSTEYIQEAYSPPIANTELKRMVEAQAKESQPETKVIERVEQETVFTPVIEEVEQEDTLKKTVFSSLPSIEIETKTVKTEEPIPQVKLQAQNITTKAETPEVKIEEPKPDFDVNPEKVEDSIHKPPVPTVETVENIKVEKPQPIPPPTTTIAEPQEEEIPEPEAPDPSAFFKIAQQIEEQTNEESATDSTNP